MAIPRAASVEMMRTSATEESTSPDAGTQSPQVLAPANHVRRSLTAEHKAVRRHGLRRCQNASRTCRQPGWLWRIKGNSPSVAHDLEHRILLCAHHMRGANKLGRAAELCVSARGPYQGCCLTPLLSDPSAIVIRFHPRVRILFSRRHASTDGAKLQPSWNSSVASLRPSGSSSRTRSSTFSSAMERTGHLFLSSVDESLRGDQAHCARAIAKRIETPQ